VLPAIAVSAKKDQFPNDLLQVAFDPVRTLAASRLRIASRTPDRGR